MIARAPGRPKPFRHAIARCVDGIGASRPYAVCVNRQPNAVRPSILPLGRDVRKCERVRTSSESTARSLEYVRGRFAP